MTNVFTLDALREEVEKEFAPVKIVVSDGSEVTLRNLLRLNKRDRDRVLEKLKVLESIEKSESEEEGSDIDRLVETAVEIVTLVADDGKKLAKELDGDISLVLKVLEVWMESTQPGEAEPSPA